MRFALPSWARSPIGISRVTSSSLLAPALAAATYNPRRRARGEESLFRSLRALRSSAQSIRWLPRSRRAAASLRRTASEIFAKGRSGAGAVRRARTTAATHRRRTRRGARLSSGIPFLGEGSRLFGNKGPSPSAPRGPLRPGRPRKMGAHPPFRNLEDVADDPRLGAVALGEGEVLVAFLVDLLPARAAAATGAASELPAEPLEEPLPPSPFPLPAPLPRNWTLSATTHLAPHSSASVLGLPAAVLQPPLDEDGVALLLVVGYRLPELAPRAYVEEVDLVGFERTRLTARPKPATGTPSLVNLSRGRGSGCPRALPC